MLNLLRGIRIAAVLGALAPLAIASPPEPLSFSAVIAPPDEPGERLQVTGTVFAPDGETPVEGVVLYVYHTDIHGYYSGTTTSSANPRLKAWVRTNAEGRYELHTIKPGPYPGGGPPAHIHYVVSGAGYPEQRHDLHFEGDARITERQAQRSRELGRFGAVRPVESGADGVLQVIRDLRLHR